MKYCKKNKYKTPARSTHTSILRIIPQFTTKNSQFTTNNLQLTIYNYIYIAIVLSVIFLPSPALAQQAVTKQGESTASGSGYVNQRGQGVGYTALTKFGEILYPCESPITDGRDGNVYDIVRIGNQCWMAENLKYLPAVVGPATQDLFTPYYYVYGYNGTDITTAKAQPNYTTYGVLYNWPASTNGNLTGSSTNPSGIQGACPLGWHLPSAAEWIQMSTYLSSTSQYWCGGSSTNIAKALASTTGWTSSVTSCAVGNDQPSNNTTGFNALPGGRYYRSTSLFSDINNIAVFWTTDNIPTPQAINRGINYNSSGWNSPELYKNNGYSVRCLRDDCPYLTAPVSGTHIASATQIEWHWGAVTSATGYKYNTTNDYATATDLGNTTSHTQSVSYGTCGEFTLYVWAYSNCGVSNVGVLKEYNYLTDDHDGQQYTTVQIGTQCWMKQNLNYAAGGWCYDNIAANCTTYGRLYDWATLMNGSASSSSNPSGVQGLCPSGWHLPSDAEWTQLTDYLSYDPTYWCGGNSTQIGRALAATTMWYYIATICCVGNQLIFNNASGFTALPSGKRQTIGSPPYYNFNSEKIYCEWFSATENTTYPTTHAWTRALNSYQVGVYSYGEPKTEGYSARCVRD